MRIWTGRSGSGKTTYILNEIADKCEKYEMKQVLLVPELYSHEMERRLAEATDNHGARTAEVLTFSRLADCVFSETGGAAQQTLNPAGQLLTLRQAAAKVQSSLKTWSGIAEKPELLKEALKLIDEIKTCSVPPEELFRAGDECEDYALSEKLTDLAQLLTEYERLCEESLPDPRDTLTRLRDNLASSGFLNGVSVYLDGFLSFTPQEFSVIDEMLRIGTSLSVAVTCDPGQPDIFVTGCKTVKTLSRMARHYNRNVEQISMGESKTKRSNGIDILERESLNPIKKPHTGCCNGVSLYSAVTPFEECEHAAAFIRKKIREDNARYRDFAVAARNMEPYSAFLGMAMSRYEVPVFLAEKPDLLSRPPIALVTGALEAVYTNFRYEELFSCFKTGLTHMRLNDIDKLENYVLTWKIRGNAWLNEWTENPDGYGVKFTDATVKQLEELNILRETAIAPFVALKEKLKGENPASECVKALYDFLVGTGVPDRLSGRAYKHEQEGRLQLANEYRQLWEILVSAMEQFAWVCGKADLTAEQFTKMFKLLLSEYDVGTIPVSLDRVRCGDIERVCGSHVKYLILLGVNDGLIPLAPSPRPMLTDSDRDKLEALGIELASHGEERLLMEQEVLYRAVSCPTRELSLSWHENDSSGKETGQSFFISIVKSLLPDVPLKTHITESALDKLESDRTAVELACSWLSGYHSAAADTAYEYYKTDKRVLNAASGKRDRGPLESGETIEKLYGKKFNLTASKIDNFYSCRFAFFMQYGIKAKPRQIAKFDAVETGTFLHYVLEHSIALLNNNGVNAKYAETDALKKICRNVVNQYIKEELGGMDNKNARFRYRFNRLARIAEQVLENVIEELKTSEFKPVDYEVEFSDKESHDMPPVEVSDGKTEVALSGKVDRVDGYIKNKRLYLRIMDYKSGVKSFSLSDIWYGLNMQLIIYLYALQEKGLDRYREKLEEELNDIVPAGVLYVPVHEELVDSARGIDDEALRKLKDRELKRSGLLSDDMELLKAMELGLSDGSRFIPVSIKTDRKTKEESLSVRSSVASLEKFGKLAKFAHKKLIEMGQLLSEGNVAADPRKLDKNNSYCNWCKFKPACQFDELSGDRMRYIKKLNDDEFWNKVGGNE